MVSVDRDGFVIWVSVQRGLLPAKIAMMINEAGVLLAQLSAVLADHRREHEGEPE